jgi:phosphoenolpyruvate carboxylase
VDSQLLDVLEQDRRRMPEVYESFSLQYRQEPYRLKLSYIQRRLELTRERNRNLADSACLPVPPPLDNAYANAEEFLADLQLIQSSLKNSGLSCRQLDHLICQVQVFGFHLAHLDIRQDSSYHEAALTEIFEYLRILPRPYSEMTEEEKTAFLLRELQTRRPLIPLEAPFSDKAAELIATFRTLRRLQQEFGMAMC